LIPALLRSSLRYLGRHPVQAGLAVLGVALGVAVVVSVDLAAASALRALNLSVGAVGGRATHQVVGGPGGLPETLYRKLRVDLRLRSCAPVVQGYVSAVRSDASPSGRMLTLLGVDPFAEGPFRGYLGVASGRPAMDLGAFLGQPGAVVMSADLAQRLGLDAGARFSLRAAGTLHSVTLAGTIEPSGKLTAQKLDALVLADISTAQELLGMEGRLSRIDLIVPPGGAGARQLAELRAALPPGAEIVAAASRAEALAQMTRAFQLNLSALGLLALVIGMFLIYNTMTFAVVQRREVIGTLRALGVTRAQVLGQVLTEALMLGVGGTLGGLILGVVLAQGLLGLVTRTINDLYFVLSVQEVTLEPSSLARGLVLGLGATLLAALMPAWEAASEPPRIATLRSVVESRIRGKLRRMSVLGLAVVGLGGAILGIPSRSILLGHIGLFSCILGAGLLAPAATAAFMGILAPGLGRLFGVLGRLGARSIVASLSRTGVAIAALAVAVSATVGVGIMIGSFRDTVAHWLQHTLRADLYVSARSEAGDAEARLDPRLLRRLGAAPGVARFTTSRRVDLPTPSGSVRIIAFSIGPEAWRAFRFKEGARAAIWTAFQERGAVIVSESYAYRHGLHAGSSLRLRTDRGERAFPVAGVYYAYGSDQGVVAMSRRTYDRFWDDPGVSGMGVYASPGTDVEQLKETLYRLARGVQDVDIRSSRAVRELSLRIFDRTFTITEVLRWLVGAVAFVGVFSALMALQLERGREMGILRATGMTPAQVWLLVSSQTGLMGLVSGLLAAPLGVAMALVLIPVINRRSFGWTLELQLDPSVILQGLLLAVGAALLAGLYPAFRMARTSPAEALREE
jgi:putative ABC transport system permease protein